MNLPLPAWLHPAPDSEVALRLRCGKSPWGLSVHLLWSVWVFVVPLFDTAGFTWRWLSLTLASYPVFLALYAMSTLAPQRRVVAYALGMIVLSMVLLPVYPSGLTYFVFGCLCLPAPGRGGYPGYMAVLVVLNAVYLSFAYALGYTVSALLWLPVTTLALGTVLYVGERERHHDATLRLSHEEVRRLAATAERERIGRDLHDLLGHTLSLVALKSDLAVRLAPPDAAAARAEMEQVGEVARQALAQVRRAVSGIRAAELAAELASARLLLESDGVALEYRVADVPLPGAAETAFALVVREAATNIQRHARARRARMDVSAADGWLVLRVDDDGRGGDCVPGNGLAGMRERLQALGGDLQVDSVRGRGTVLRARVPLAAEPVPARPPSTPVE